MDPKMAEATERARIVWAHCPRHGEMSDMVRVGVDQDDQTMYLCSTCGEIVGENEGENGTTPQQDLDEQLFDLLGRTVLVILDRQDGSDKRYVAGPLRQVRQYGGRHPRFWHVGSCTSAEFTPFVDEDITEIVAVRGNVRAVIHLLRAADERTTE